MSIGKSLKSGKTFKTFVTPYLMNTSAMVIANISHSAFSVIQKIIFHHHLSRFNLRNKSVLEMVDRSLPLFYFLSLSERSLTESLIGVPKNPKASRNLFSI